MVLLGIYSLLPFINLGINLIGYDAVLYMFLIFLGTIDAGADF